MLENGTSTVDIKKSKKTNKVLISAVVALVILLIVGLSFAYFKYFKKSGAVVYGDLTIDESRFTLRDQISEEAYKKQLDDLVQLKDKIRNDPENPGFWFDFGFIKNYLSDYEGARLAWEKSFEFNPLRLATSNNLGDIYAYHVIDYSRAELYYLKALNLRPDNYHVYIKLADLYQYQMTGRGDEIEPLLTKALKNDKYNELNYLSYLYEYFDKQGDAAKATNYRQQVLKINPKFFTQ